MLVAGVDLGGTAVNYTLLNDREEFLIEDLCEHPARSTEGPAICLKQIANGLKVAVEKAGGSLADVAVVGLDTPGPASATGMLSTKGSTDFVHADWASFDMRGNLAQVLDKPVVYLNAANAAAVWGHFALFGTSRGTTSISCIVGTGHGGGIIMDGAVIKGRKGLGGELGHVLIPYQMIPGAEGLKPECNCGRLGDLESLCSLTSIRKHLLPHFLKKYPDHSRNPPKQSMRDDDKILQPFRPLVEGRDHTAILPLLLLWGLASRNCCPIPPTLPLLDFRPAKAENIDRVGTISSAGAEPATSPQLLQ